MIHELSLQFAEQELIINHLRSIYWPKHRTLILSDLHLGKAAHFRHYGISIPQGVTLSDLERLNTLILFYNPERIIIAGDLIHHGLNKEVLLLQSFIHEKHPNRIFSLVLGNHDRTSQKHLEQLHIQDIQSSIQLDNIIIQHEPLLTISPHQYVISGHIHPGSVIGGRSQKKLRLPTFIVSPQQIIMPAFSHFTGLNTQFEWPNSERYVVTVEGLVRLNNF